MENFRELSLEEMQEVEGGIFPLLAGLRFVGGALIGGAIVEVITEGWDQCMADFQAGYNEVRRTD